MTKIEWFLMFQVTKMITPLDYLSAATYNNCLYVAGGYGSDKNAVETVQK